jgi:ribosomal small subunit protein bTHX
MGKGDKKSRRGKIHIGSYGRLRPAKKKLTDFIPAEKPEPVIPVKPEIVTVEAEKKPVKKAVKKPKEETNET